MDVEPLPFSLDWLAGAAEQKHQLSVCADGHLVVHQRSCWQPLYFSADGRALYCRPVRHDEN